MKLPALIKFALTSPSRVQLQVRRLTITSGQSNTLNSQRIEHQSWISSSQDVSFKIVDHDDRALDQLQEAGSNIELADLECRLPNRQTLSFNLTWLRDSCHCEHCTHKFSRQRLFTQKDFRKNLFAIDHIQVVTGETQVPGHVIGSKPSADSYLKIKWADGHKSFHSLNWLSKLHSLYKEPKLQKDPRLVTRHMLPRDDFYASRHEVHLEPQFWSVSSIQANLKHVDYYDLLDGFEFHDSEPTFINANCISDMSARRLRSIASLCEQLVRFGLAKIVNVPRERNQVLKVAKTLAYERPTGYGTVFDVVIEPSEEINLAYSAHEFDLHSDLTYRESSPGVQMLHCIENSVDGGLSFFSDAFQAAAILKSEYPKLFDVLVNYPAVFVVRDPYRDVKFRRQKPIISLDYAGNLQEVYYSPFMLPPVGHKDDVKLFYLAQDKFTQLLQAKENKLITKMDPGDLFIFNNRRVLHGRSAYDPKTSNRFLQGCYMDWDEIICLFEKFQYNKIN